MSIENAGENHGHEDSAEEAVHDILDVPAVTVISEYASQLLTIAQVKCGAVDGVEKDLDEARKLITAAAGFITAAAPELGDHHARWLRDALRQTQLAFRAASTIQDAPGAGPGEKFTGPVN